MTVAAYYAGLWRLLQVWMPQLLVAAGGTLRMIGLAFIVAAAVGLALALARLSRYAALSRFAVLYIEVVRGTPALTQLFLIYFGLTAVGLTLQAFQAAVVGLGLNGAAYLAEVYRAGIQAIHRGQREAAQAIGMGRLRALRRIVLPQAMRVVIPPLGNEFIGMVKATSLASVIQYPELLHNAENIYYANSRVIELLIVAGLWYLLVVSILTPLQMLLERRFARGTLRLAR